MKCKWPCDEEFGEDFCDDWPVFWLAFLVKGWYNSQSRLSNAILCLSFEIAVPSLLSSPLPPGLPSPLAFLHETLPVWPIPFCKQQENIKELKNSPTTKSSRHPHRTQIPPHQRRNQIRTAKDIESTTKNTTSNSMGDREDPWDLRLVDCEMWCYGAVFSLGDEDFVGVRGCEVGCCLT